MPRTLCRFAAITLAAVTIAMDAPAYSADPSIAPSVAGEPPARVIVDAPLPGPLSRGTVVIAFHADHMQILPIYGPTAATVSPRVGHLHLTLDHASWHWLQASNDLIVLQGLPAGPHTLLVELADANHRVVDSTILDFTVPTR